MYAYCPVLFPVNPSPPTDRLYFLYLCCLLRLNPAVHNKCIRLRYVFQNQIPLKRFPSFCFWIFLIYFSWQINICPSVKGDLPLQEYSIFHILSHLILLCFCSVFITQTRPTSQQKEVGKSHAFVSRVLAFDFRHS